MSSRGLDLLNLATGALAGAALAGLHLAALWWSVERAVGASRPGLALAVSAFVRVAVVGLGLALVALRGPAALFAALAGFLITRGIVLARARGRRRERGAP